MLFWQSSTGRIFGLQLLISLHEKRCLSQQTGLHIAAEVQVNDCLQEFVGQELTGNKVLL